MKMTHNQICAAIGLMITCCLLCLGCQAPLGIDGTPAPTNLAITIQGGGPGTGARSLLPPNVNIISYAATLTGPGAVTTVTSATPSFTIPSLPAGDWLIQVSGLGESACVLATGQGNVHIDSGKSTAVIIQLATASGVGKLKLQVTWPAASPVDEVSGELTDSLGKSTLMNLALNSNAAGTELAGLQAGEYTLILNLKLKGFQCSAPIVESVSIRPGQTTLGSFGPGPSTFSVFGGASTLAGWNPQLDGDGAGATFNSPWGIATDGTNLYVADSRNHVIRRCVIATGTVSVFAGKFGESGSSDGVGLNARFSNPYGVCCDGANLYIADSGNYTIRKMVIQTGMVSTLAGLAKTPGQADGTGSAARFTGVFGLAVNGSNLYLTDGNCIRKLVLANNAVSLFAGSNAAMGSGGSVDGTGGSARFNGLHGIISIGTYLYVADSLNNTVRRIDTGTAAVVTVAGMAGYAGGSVDGLGTSARFNYPEGLASDGLNIYVSDANNNTLRKMPTTNFAVSTVAGSAGFSGFVEGAGTAARFYNPRGIAFAGGSLFVADYGNCAIRAMVVASNAVTTLAGSPGPAGSVDGSGVSVRFNYPEFIAISGTDLFVSDTGNNTIRKISLVTKAVSTFAGSSGSGGSSDGIALNARFNGPRGIALASSTLFVVDSANHTIRKINLLTGEVTTLAGSPGNAGSADGVGNQARFNLPMGMARIGDKLFVADMGNNTIRQVSITDGSVSTLSGTANPYGGIVDGIGPTASFSAPTGIATDGARLFVSDQSSSTIRMVDVATREVTTIAGNANNSGSLDGVGLAARFANPYGIVYSDGNLFICDRQFSIIRRLNLSTREVSTIGGVASAGEDYINGSLASARFKMPGGLVMVGTKLLIVDTFNCAIRTLAP